MKIKKTKSKKVIVEFDEFLNLDSPAWTESETTKTLLIIEKMNQLSPRRTSYNMWEFNSKEDALEALFVLNLKS
jgi:hypothetical protein